MKLHILRKILQKTLYNAKKTCYTLYMNKKSIYYVEYKDDNFYFLTPEGKNHKGITNYVSHNHPYHEIMYVEEGAVEYLVENRRYELEKGDVLLVKPGLLHFARRIIESPYKRFCIGFNTAALENGKLAESFFAMGEHFSIKEFSIFGKLIGILKEKLESKEENSASFVKHSIELMMLSLSDEGLGEEKEEQIPDSKLKHIRTIIGFINENLKDIKRIDDISEALFFSKSYLGHLFKRETGMGVMEYVRNKKVMRAHERMKAGEKPTEIYSDCGFSNYPSFYRAYVAYFGRSPINYKYKNE